LSLIGAGSDLPSIGDGQALRGASAAGAAQRLPHIVHCSPLRARPMVAPAAALGGGCGKTGLLELDFRNWDRAARAQIDKAELDAWVADFRASDRAVAKASRNCWNVSAPGRLARLHRCRPCGWMLARRWMAEKPGVFHWPKTGHSPAYGESGDFKRLSAALLGPSSSRGSRHAPG